MSLCWNYDYSIDFNLKNFKIFEHFFEMEDIILNRGKK